MGKKPQAFWIDQFGSPEKAFTLRDLNLPETGDDEVRIEVEGFGINFADVTARQGLYRDAPKPPFVPGYEVVGKVMDTGKNVHDLEAGVRVVAFTRFGGYSQEVLADAAGVVPISETMPLEEACSMATQYCTAWYAAEELTRIFPGDHVLIQAAAGGVGSCLVQLAKRRGAIVYGTASKPEKLKYLEELGCDYPINYMKAPFDVQVRKLLGKNKLDIVYVFVEINDVTKMAPK